MHNVLISECGLVLNDPIEGYEDGEFLMEMRMTEAAMIDHCFLKMRDNFLNGIQF